MVYDKDLMKWMRASTRVPSDAEDHISVTDAESEDPFKDVENLREDDSAGTNENVGVAAKEIPTARPEEAMEEAHFKQDMTRIEEGDEEDANDQEELDLTSFSFGSRSVTEVRVIPSREGDTGEDASVARV
ncbi:hypothetical protein L210DRAFT_3638206 [Boletus edulis BED1]|uniref:Uncharacterized protein n=1 Tax=Boletus edulis BED1 TaxID=1328754 RepID=A0AAD4BA87_BOLED|nr:hypothetical protein L210DRAFT_3638206 [Boletus edulis BED1]